MRNFIKIYDTFMASDMGQQLSFIKEDSKWHREESVREHTRMVLAWYRENLANSRSNRQETLTFVALLFHDAGKPRSRTEKFNEERGTYYSYPGHEKVSARMFVDFFMTNRKLFEHLTWSDIRTIRFLIEHHLPYEMKDDKLMNLKRDLMFQGDDVIQMYYDVLRSDAHGRISDDPEGTYSRVEDWIYRFDSLEVRPISIPSSHSPILHLLIGAAGSGKSTLSKKLVEDGFAHFSLDHCREAVYEIATGNVNDYHSAYLYCCDHEQEFNNYCATEYTKMVKEGRNIVLDNTNCTAKSRRRWIVQARQAGYKVVATEIFTSLKTVIDRQDTRGDKKIPKDAVERHYFSVALPLIGSEIDYYYIEVSQ